MRSRALLILVPAIACSCSGVRGTAERPEQEPVPLGKLRANADYLLPSGKVTFSPAEVADRGRGARGLKITVPPARGLFTLEGDCAPVRWAVAGPVTATVEPVASPASAEAPQASADAGAPEEKETTAAITFEAPGEYLVTAACGGSRRQLAVSLCNFEENLSHAVTYYGASIDFTQVSLVYEPTLLGQSWTRHNSVTIGSGWLDASEGCPPASHYVHEFGHVWEHQHGQGQLARGAVDQLMNLVTDVYDFGGPDGVRAALAAGKPLESFNLEQQAEIFATDFEMRGYPDDPYAQDLSALTRPALASPPQ
jgi:hypothetical protein